jgi:tRNA-dihydrouridine synthase B
MNEIHFAPLQGLTDHVYRTIHFQYIRDVDFYYTPYYSADDLLTFQTKNYPEELFRRTIPQILPGNMDELKLLFQFIYDHHFSFININLGCPYPMVTRKGRGAALIRRPNLVSDMVHFINDHSNLIISLKARLGLDDETEIFNLLEKVKPEEVGTITVHPRTAKQLYKGEASSLIFQQCKVIFPQFDLVYNGDINSVEDFIKLNELIKGQNKWMLGRGLLSNPLLGRRIKNVSSNMPDNFYKELFNFVFHLIEGIETDSKNKGHALNRVKSQFEYLSNAFPCQQIIYRTIRKSKSLIEIKEFLNEERCKILSNAD